MNLKSLLYLLGTFTIGIAIGYYFGERAVDNSSYLPTCNFRLHERNDTLAIGSHIQLIELSKTIERNFTCMKTKFLFDLFQTTICLHDQRKRFTCQSNNFQL